MRHMIKFNALEDFNRFAARTEDDIAVVLKNERRLTMAVEGLEEERIPQVEKDYNAKVFQDIQFSPF